MVHCIVHIGKIKVCGNNSYEQVHPELAKIAAPDGSEEVILWLLCIDTILCKARKLRFVFMSMSK